MAELTYQLVMPDAETIAEIGKLVREDRLEEALKELSNMEECQHEATLLARRLNRIRGQERKGTTTRDEASSERSKIAEAILQIAEEQALSRTKPLHIPFVVSAMTRTEANMLITEEVFSDPDARKRFHDFREELTNHTIVDLLPHYRERREDWTPYSNHQDPIGKIIVNTFADINQLRRDEQDSPFVCPQFRSAEFFDDAKQSQTWYELSNSGCVLIVDAVSLFHPTLRRMLSGSGMTGWSRHVAIFVLSPVSFSALRVNRLIEQQLDIHMKPTFTRFAKHMDELCEFGIGGIPRLRRWICAVLPEVQAYLRGEVPTESNKNWVQQQVGKPSGHARFISGR